ncbi:hypothetical protein ANASTE_00321 [Anaerofustis stercorihominis DSM 17244]|uniref:Uncharacterized protein n=1 Tax=Anaerofustis stercorihominis DSM 17244 TaxID=445971 RepID=B1C6I1_9FIRM|nr:hypothetical protein ANASTE_00321 [Anaerofustis stercorihominis DSM 17244]
MLSSDFISAIYKTANLNLVYYRSLLLPTLTKSRKYFFKQDFPEKKFLSFILPTPLFLYLRFFSYQSLLKDLTNKTFII